MADPCDDLDRLLDSALDDFTKLDLAPTRNGPEGDGGEGKVEPLPSLSSCPSSSSAGVQGLGMGLPDLKSKKKGKQRVPPPLPKSSVASEALDKLTQQTREAVRGLESATGANGGSPAIGAEGFNNESMVEEFVKQFEELAGSQDMESIVETMMHQLLSKEILQEPMKEIGERYPKWLEEHESGMSREEYDRYHRQYELILKLNDVYENDSGNFSKIVELMQKMQECGQPPNEIVQELAPDLDLSNLGQLSPDLLDSTSQCSIM